MTALGLVVDSTYYSSAGTSRSPRHLDLVKPFPVTAASGGPDSSSQSSAVGGDAESSPDQAPP